MTADDWRAGAACRDLPNLFFPRTGDSATAQLAKEICADCPVREPCLAYALTWGPPAGIWAGFASKQIRKERRRLGMATGVRGKAPITHGSSGGAQAHRRRGEDPCKACAREAAEYQRRYTRKARTA